MDAQSFGEAVEAMFLLIFWGFVVLCVVCSVAVGGCTYFASRTTNTAPLPPATASQGGQANSHRDVYAGE